MVGIYVGNSDLFWSISEIKWAALKYFCGFPMSYFLYLGKGDHGMDSMLTQFTGSCIADFFKE